MRCHYCGWLNSKGRERCERCESRLDALAVPLTSSAVPRTDTTGFSVQTDPRLAPAKAQRTSSFPVQEWLIEPEQRKVLQFPGEKASSGNKKSGGGRSKNGGSGQGTFDFLPRASLAQRDRARPAGVAPRILRFRAGLIDLAVTIAALALFLLPFQLMGGQFVFNSRTALPWLAVVLFVGLGYRLFWCLCNCETPGMRFYDLHVVDFDGGELSKQRRVGRFFVAGITSVAVGLGPLSSLTDPEGLTWHDQISRTFPTQFRSRSRR